MQRTVRSSNVRIVPFLSDFQHQLMCSAVSISMGGDNTLLDVLNARTPALAYPYQGNSEQSTRIARFAEKGLLQALQPEDLEPSRLKDKINRALQMPYPARTVLMGRGAHHQRQDQRCARVNATATENQRPGTSDWQLVRPAMLREIEGYASATSVNRGEAIELFVHTHAAHYTLEVFRVGWYQGQGARSVFGPSTVAGTVQPMPEMDPVTGLVDCTWGHAFVLATRSPDDPQGWPSGVYLTRLTAADSGAQSYIIFVVRDDERSAELLVQLGFTTYQAYNNWGGKSLYNWGSTGHARAAKVSFNRPYAANAQNPAAAVGMGAGEF